MDVRHPSLCGQALECLQKEVVRANLVYGVISRIGLSLSLVATIGLLFGGSYDGGIYGGVRGIEEIDKTHGSRWMDGCRDGMMWFLKSVVYVLLI